MRYDLLARERLKELRGQRAAIKRGEDPQIIIPTGLKEFDRRAGIKRGILTLVGGVTGGSKDVFTQHLMMAAAKAGHQVDVVAPEDPTSRVVDRSVATGTGINSMKLLSADVSDDEMDQVEDAVDAIDGWGQRIEYSTDLMGSYDALQWLRSSEASLRIFNYLQILGTEGESLESVIADFCKEAQSIAAHDNCAIVAVSQLNTVKVETRGIERVNRSRWRDPEADPDLSGYRPAGLSDLSWCTRAGQLAKEVILLHRPGKFARQHGINVPDDRLELIRIKASFASESKLVLGIDVKTSRVYELPKAA